MISASSKSRNLRRFHARWLRIAVLAAALVQWSVAQGWGAFVESAGKVVMEAEHFQTNKAGSGRAWVATNNVAGSSGGVAMQAWPDAGANLTSVTASPSLGYSIQVTNAGAFNLWVRGWAANGSSDSVYVGVDGAQAQAVTYGSFGTWVWKSARVTIATAGKHEIDLWMREDGAYVDRLILSADLSYVPAGLGPAETGLDVRITSPLANATFVSGSSLLLEAEVVGVTPALIRFYADGVLLGADFSPPYSFAGWTPAQGVHQLAAVALDAGGNGFTSPPVTVTITAPLAPTFRWAADSSRIYVESGGTATLSQIQAALPNAPLCLLDATNHLWFLGATLFVTDGATLLLHGSAAGGDVDELRMRSDNSTADGSVAALDADWGTLDLNGVKVISWDQLTSAPDKEFRTFGRAFIRARSREPRPLIQISTLKVVNSEIAYLGDNQPTSYGLTWNLVGGAPDVTVRGVVSGSRIHDCELGVAGWSAGKVAWAGNAISSNTLYGFAAFNQAQQAVVAANQVFSNSFGVSFRWAHSNSRIYVTGPGDATLSDVKKALPAAPLSLIDPVNKVWYLEADLWVTEGARLKLYGPAIGGDVSQLRMKSDASTASNAFVEMRADWGWLDIRNTKITSWNNLANGPNTITNYGRAFIHARSKLDRDGHTPHESRMDVINSDIGYLGMLRKEAYGLVWKVVDTTAIYLPRGATSTLFDLVNVYGDILNSHIHNNCFGVYTYGAFGCHWAADEVDHNLGYGFDPHDDSDQLVIENNHVHHNGWHGIIASKRCDHGIMRNNLTHDNGLDPIIPHGNGIMLHRSSSDWIVTNNFSYNNPDSGMAIFAAERNLVINNVFSNNAIAGIRLSVGADQNRIDGNQFLQSGTNGLDLYTGTDLPEPNIPLNPASGLKTVRPHHNIFTNNVVKGYGMAAVSVAGGDSNSFAGNVFTGTKTVLAFVNASNNVVMGNSLPTNSIVTLSGTSTITNLLFATATFQKQSLLNLQLGNNYAGATFADSGSAIFDVAAHALNTTAAPSGSTLNLTPALLGTGTNVVRTRNLTAVPSSGSVLVHPTTWNLSGTYSKAWTAQSVSGTPSVSFVVGDLLPGTKYKVLQGSSQVATPTADSQGSISFKVSVGSSSAVTFSVSPR